MRRARQAAREASRLCRVYLLGIGEDFQPQAPAYAHHLIRSRGRPAHAQHRVTLLQKTHRDRMKYFVERFVTNFLRSCQRHQRQCQPFSQHRNMPRAKNGQSVRLHILDIPANQRRIVVRPRAVRTGDQNHHRFARTGNHTLLASCFSLQLICSTGKESCLFRIRGCGLCPNVLNASVTFSHARRLPYAEPWWPSDVRHKNPRRRARTSACSLRPRRPTRLNSGPSTNFTSSASTTSSPAASATAPPPKTSPPKSSTKRPISRA